VWSEALVVRHDLAVGPEVAKARRVETTDDGDPLAARRDEERALPGTVGAADDEVEAGVRGEQRLSRERQPEVDVLLLEDPRAWSSFSWMSTCGVVRAETLVGAQGQRYR
jgi:hypothetical protein